ncbi:hypothetical protein [Rhodococcus jostii]|uniref:Uncharacterized protein n=1 Tax=Rhodococcus jostii TaxID=132919 RepID=A0A1H4ZCQ6_RHOJO|nr:hypothetical protein [Rhodococcus jostii]SED27737.1 hypothetical protein SAMN04490220_4043 [Rhodococcus jostii]
MIWARPANALRHVEKLEARVTRIVAGFAASDVFWSSGCDPGWFLTNTSGSLIVPHMLWEVDSGDVIAVDEVDVGYGGAAPSRALTLLGELGLSDPVARGIAYSRRSVTQLGCDGSTVLHSIAHADWPGFQLHTPTRIGASWVLRVTSDNLRNSLLQAGAPPRPGAGKIGQMIARELDRVDLPDWAHGRRTARLFDDCGAAQDAGFVDRRPQRSPVPDRPRTYRLIVEQGLLQLWFELPEPGEAGVLSREARDLIANLDISDGPR